MARNDLDRAVAKLLNTSLDTAKPVQQAVCTCLLEVASIFRAGWYELWQAASIPLWNKMTLCGKMETFILYLAQICPRKKNQIIA